MPAEPEPVEAIVLEHPDGAVHIEEGPRRRLTVVPSDPSAFVARRTCETDYPLELIRALLDVKGPAWLCDEIARDVDPDYIERTLRSSILPYVGLEAFAGRRVLDFGCGSGASTMVLRRLLPDCEIVGVELEEDLVAIARMRARHYGAEGVRFEASPTPDALPDGIGTFDHVFLSAVYEHMLPAERRRLPSMLWSVLGPGGTLFLNETPHRWFVVETHTTGLPLLNFLPQRLAHRAAVRLVPGIGRDADWTTLLRQGIRGATPKEILGDLAAGGGRPRLLEPSRQGIGDAVDLWYAHGAPTGKRRALRGALKVASAVTRQGYVPYLFLAIRKDA